MKFTHLLPDAPWWVVLSILATFLSASDEQKMMILWGRRSRLDAEELELLCRLVIEALRRCNAPELRSLREDEDLRQTRERYIQDFLLAKVLDTERFSDSRLDSTGVLVGYFRNFLLNMIDSAEEKLRRSAFSIDSGDDDAPDIDAVCHATDSDQAPSQWIDRAREFAFGLDRRYQVLLLSYCADEAVYAVAKRYNIASAAHYAAKLGITKRHEGPPPDYEKTLIGGWIRNILKLSFDLDHMNELRQAFDALCAASFELRSLLEEGSSA